MTKLPSGELAVPSMPDASATCARTLNPVAVAPAQVTVITVARRLTLIPAAPSLAAWMPSVGVYVAVSTS